MTNQTDLVRVKVRLNQVISNGTGGPGSNVPTGLTMTNDGSLVTVASGTITSGDQTFKVESPITKDITKSWEAGSNKGGLLTSTSAQTEKLNAFVISTGVVYDIAFTFDDTPTLPTGYNLYAKIGHVLLNEGAITELWPTKDLGTSWVDNDIYTAINETNTRVTANSEELTNVKADIVDINTSVEGLDTATSEIQAKIPAEASDTNQLADKQFVQDLTSALNFVTWVDTLPATGESKYIYAVPREEVDKDGKKIAALYLWDGTEWRGAGAFSLNVDPDTLATKTDLTNYLPLTGGRVTGQLIVDNNTIAKAVYVKDPALSGTWYRALRNNGSSGNIIVGQYDGIVGTEIQTPKNTITANIKGTSTNILTALDKSVANGVASLDGTAKLPVNQLPTNVILNGDVLLDSFKRIYQQKIDDTFYCADKRFTVALTNFDNYPQRLFDANDDTYISLPKGQTGSVLIEGEYNFGKGYPYGYLYAMFYHGCGLTDISNITGRVYQDWTGHNVGWVNLNAEEIFSKKLGDYKSIELVRFRVSQYGIRKIELNFDNTDGTSPTEGDNLRVTCLSYFKERVPISELPVVTKFGDNTLYGNVTIPTQYGSFIGNVTGNLTGTASKATSDAAGNNIASTYVKANTKGTANGVASLDANAKIPAAQIPVDGTTITVNAEGNLVSAGGSGGDAMAVVKLTQAEYDALNPKDPSTIYAIKMEEE